MIKKKEKVVKSAKESTTCKLKKIDKLDITFQSEDLNKLVEKINEIIEN